MYKDITGKKFGRLLVLSRGERVSGVYKWNCLCDCGNKTVVLGTNLRHGNTKSCGCLHKEVVGKTHFKHGYSKRKNINRLYRCWSGIRTRTHNPKCSCAKNYINRGVSCCEEWEVFENFKNWALSNGYQENLTIDRIDVNGNYCPENCRWIPFEEQSQNRRNTLKYKGIPITELCKGFGINYHTLMTRVYTERNKGVSKESVFEKTFGDEILAQINRFRKND